MLKITKTEYDALRRHAEAAYPDECCGVLLGHVHDSTRTVLATVSTGNVRTDSPQNRYAIDPRDMVRIQREARACGLDIVGFYHSHPGHPARWSSTDLEEAHWLGCSYVITSVQQGRAAETNSFALAGSGEEDKNFVDEPVEVVVAPPVFRR